MEVTLSPTSRIVTIDGKIEARLWQGRTNAGIEVYALVCRIAVHRDADCTDFEKALLEQEPPSAAAVAAFPLLRMVL